MHDEYELWIYGADGSQWPVHGKPSWGRDVRLKEGTLGEFYDAPLSTTYKARAGQPGAQYRGFRYLERHVVLNLVFYNSDWQPLLSRIKRAFAPDRDAQLAVRTPHAGERRLTVRLEEAPKYADGRDPFSRQFAEVQFVLIAADPLWTEPVQYTDEFVFNGSNWAGEGLVVENPTDTPVWPKWVMTAPAKFGIPDIAIGQEYDQDRMLWLPFQPTNRASVLVDTDPGEELITANDGTLLWAKMNGQFPQHPIPPFTPPTVVPVAVDPFPLLPFDLPTSWRMWIGEKLRELVRFMGLEDFLALTPEDIGRKVSDWMKGVTPDWLEPIHPDLIAEFTGSFIAKLIRETYGRIGNIAGATCQVRLDRRWQHPWD